jgi:hypothetical protein
MDPTDSFIILSLANCDTPAWAIFYAPVNHAEAHGTPKHSEGGLAKAGRLACAERICGHRQLNRGNFFSELKRRNVYRVAALGLRRHARFALKSGTVSHGLP